MDRPGMVVGGVALLLLAPLVVAAQGLGDASKKEKARREQTKTTATTYPQDELSTLPPVANEPATNGESTPVPASSAPLPNAGDSAPPGATGDPSSDRSSGTGEGERRNDESIWRGSVAQATARVERARRSYQTLAGMNLVPGYEYQDEKGRTVIHSVDELQRMTAAAKAELDAAEKALADLLERARRAGIPPGWLR